MIKGAGFPISKVSTIMISQCQLPSAMGRRTSGHCHSDEEDLVFMDLWLLNTMLATCLVSRVMKGKVKFMTITHMVARLTKAVSDIQNSLSWEHWICFRVGLLPDYRDAHSFFQG